jgi:hypothetical protein
MTTPRTSRATWARLSGYLGWTGEPCTAASWRHISVYEPAGPAVA